MISLSRSLAPLVAVLAVTGCGASLDRGARGADVVLAGAPAMHVSGKASAGTPEEALPARNALDAPGAFAFIERGEGGTWLVLARADADLAAGVPVLRTDPATGFVLLEAKAQLSQLERGARLEGRRFDLWSGDHKACTVRAGAVRVMGVTSTPPDMMDPQPAEDGELPPVSATDLWGVASHYVAVPVDVPASCAGAGWARLSELPEPRFAEQRGAVAPAIERDAVAAFRATAAWSKAQHDFEEARSTGGASVGLWEDAGTSRLLVWEARFAAASFVVRQATWDEGCSMSVGLTKVWTQTPAGLEPVFEADDWFDPELVLDLDGDGRLEMIGGDASGRELRRFWSAGEGEASEALLRYSVPSQGCGC